MRAALRTAALGALVSSLAAVASAQSYGPREQVRTIGAAELRAEDDSLNGVIRGANGYLSVGTVDHPTAPSQYIFRAPLSLPEGARIDRICSWVHDTDVEMDVSVSLSVVKLTYGGESPHLQAVGPTVSSNLAPGYRSYCADVDETVAAMRDVDGDGNADAIAWYVRVVIGAASDDLGIAAIQVAWRREVVAPPGTPTFADVPDTHPFYRYVEALSASGITGGCGDGTVYCPDAPLTRGQMAVFLARALGLSWSD